MNVRQLAAGVTGAVTPEIAITVQTATGYTTGADGTQTPTYTSSSTTGSVQPLDTQDLKKLDGLNIQNVTQKVFLNGDYEGVFRVLGKGGDLLTFNGQTWLVTAVLERWADWTCVGVTMQV